MIIPKNTKNFIPKNKKIDRHINETMTERKKNDHNWFSISTGNYYIFFYYFSAIYFVSSYLFITF